MKDEDFHAGTSRPKVRSRLGEASGGARVGGLKTGDRVIHTAGGFGAGTVERIDEKGVHVRFDAKSAARRHLRAVFDEQRLTQHPEGLKRIGDRKR